MERKEKRNYELLTHTFKVVSTKENRGWENRKYKRKEVPEKKPFIVYINYLLIQI